MYCLPIITYPFRDKDGLRYTFRRQLSANSTVEGRYLISLPNKTERKLRKTLWWAGLDSNQRWVTRRVYSPLP